MGENSKIAWTHHTNVKALSLAQPWAFIVLHLGKRIENRSRNLGSYRGMLALHASKGMRSADWDSAFAFVHERFGFDAAGRIPRPDSPLLVRGAIVGVCEVVDSFGPDSRLAQADHSRGLSDQWRWYMGQHAYVLDQVRELTAPIPCKGALGFWTPPADVVAQVRAWMSGGAADMHGLPTPARP